MGVRSPQPTADSGFFCNQNLREMEARGIAAYLPDANLARELNTGERAGGVGRMAVSDPSLRRLRQRLRTTEGRAWYKKEAQGAGRAGVRHLERAARDATVPAPRPVGGAAGVHAGRHRLQSHPLSHLAAQRLTLRPSPPSQNSCAEHHHQATTGHIAQNK